VFSTKIVDHGGRPDNTCENSPDGGIQWLRVKPWLCFIGHWVMRPSWHRRIHMVIEIVVNLPVFFVASISLLATTIS
jgi:hypothetical protein